MSPNHADPTLDFLESFDDPDRWVIVPNAPICIPHQRTIKKGDDEQTIVVTSADLPEIAQQLQEREAVYGVPPVMTIGHRQQTDPAFPETNQPPIVGYSRHHRVGTFGPANVPAVLGTLYYKREHWDKGFGQNGKEGSKDFPFRSMDFYPGTKKVTGVALLKRDPYLPLGMVTYSATTNQRPQTPKTRTTMPQQRKPVRPQPKQPVAQQQHPVEYLDPDTLAAIGGPLAGAGIGAGLGAGAAKLAGKNPWAGAGIGGLAGAGAGALGHQQIAELIRSGALKPQDIGLDPSELESGREALKAGGGALRSLGAMGGGAVTSGLTQNANYANEDGREEEEKGKEADEPQDGGQPEGSMPPEESVGTLDDGQPQEDAEQPPEGHAEWRAHLEHAMKTHPVLYGMCRGYAQASTDPNTDPNGMPNGMPPEEEEVPPEDGTEGTPASEDGELGGQPMPPETGQDGQSGQPGQPYNPLSWANRNLTEGALSGARGAIVGIANHQKQLLSDIVGNANEGYGSDMPVTQRVSQGRVKQGLLGAGIGGLGGYGAHAAAKAAAEKYPFLAPLATDAGRDALVGGGMGLGGAIGTQLQENDMPVGYQHAISAVQKRNAALERKLQQMQQQVQELQVANAKARAAQVVDRFVREGVTALYQADETGSLIPSPKRIDSLVNRLASLPQQQAVAYAAEIDAYWDRDETLAVAYQDMPVGKPVGIQPSQNRMPGEPLFSEAHARRADEYMRKHPGCDWEEAEQYAMGQRPITG